MKRKIILLTTLFFLSVFISVWASPNQTKHSNKVRSFIKKMVNKHGFKPEKLKKLFTQVNVRQELLEMMDKPTESLPWHVYRTRMVTDKRAKLGLKYWQSHRKALLRAKRKYGIPPSIIVAIIGIETNYGANKGSYPIIDTLTTLAFHYPRRANFFTSELEQYLLLTRTNKFDPLKLNGSYAGAMGIPQFMPSSYRSYAVDFSGNGTKDLLNDHIDAIGSVANYLHSHGWRDNQPILAGAKVKGHKYNKVLRTKLKPIYSIKKLEKYGVKPRGKVSSKRKATLIKLKGEKSPRYWLGFYNFYVISRYNPNVKYTMAVYQLSHKIRLLKQEQIKMKKSKKLASRK